LLRISAGEFIAILAESQNREFVDVAMAKLQRVSDRWHALAAAFENGVCWELLPSKCRIEFLLSACEYRPALIAEVLAKGRVDPAREDAENKLLKQCLKCGIDDAVLTLLHRQGKADQAAEHAQEALQARLLVGNDSAIVTQVIDFLLQSKADGASWEKCLQAFRLPVYDRLMNGNQALLEIMPLLERFLHAMAAKCPDRVSEQFIDNFKFLSMDFGRPLVMRFFRGQRQRRDVDRMHMEIADREHIERQMAWYVNEIRYLTVDLTKTCERRTSDVQEQRMILRWGIEPETSVQSPIALRPAVACLD
jgi:hypothetical protein